MNGFLNQNQTNCDIRRSDQVGQEQSREVPAALCELQSQLSALDIALTSLEKRLSPLLAVEPSVPTTEKPMPAGPATVLASALHSEQLRVRRLRSFVDYLERCVQL